MTQTSASSTSWIWLVVRTMSPTKMETWWAISSEANITPKMMPKYLELSPRIGSMSGDTIMTTDLGTDTVPVRLYSYMRCSGHRQKRGHSLRRQNAYDNGEELGADDMAALAQEICRRENAVLDDTLTFVDA